MLGIISWIMNNKNPETDIGVQGEDQKVKISYWKPDSGVTHFRSQDLEDRGKWISVSSRPPWATEDQCRTRWW